MQLNAQKTIDIIVETKCDKLEKTFELIWFGMKIFSIYFLTLLKE